MVVRTHGFTCCSALLTLLLAAVAPACSPKRVAINSIANTLARGGDTFGSDRDPVLVRDAAPFSLKLIESVLAETPKHRGLLVTACAGFTQYAYAFVDLDAEMLKLDDYSRHSRLQERARTLYVRGRDYCLRSLEFGHPGLRAKLAQAPDAAVAVLQKEDVSLIYWTAASWGKAIALGLDRPDVAGDVPLVQALARRALALDESFGEGAIHELMITLESLPAAMGGNRERARQHYERIIDLAHGNAAGPHLTYAMGVLLPQQQRAPFAAHLRKALDVDVDREPRLRIANIVAQRYARYLLEHLDQLFLEDREASREPK